MPVLATMTSGDYSNSSAATSASATIPSSSAQSAKTPSANTGSSSYSYYNSYSGNMHHVAMSHHNSHLAPLGASPQYTPHTPASQHQPAPQRHTPASTPVSRRTSVDSNPGKGTKRKRAAGYDHNGMLSESEFEKRARAMADGDEEPLTENEKHALRNSTVTEDGRHVCGACGRTLVSQWGLDAHIKTVHGRKSFKCEFCHKAFGRRDHLVNHTNSIHTGNKECSQCGVMCKGKDGLMNHIREHHPATPPQHPCNVCGKKFPTEDNARVHYAQIHGEVKCSECHMVCVGTEGLKGHVKAFHQNSAMAAQQLHHSPAPAASHLGNGFHHHTPTPGAPQSHPGGQQQQQHHGILSPAARRPPFVPSVAVHPQPPSGGTYKCQYCSGTFLQRATLEKHTESFHVELQCGYCGSTFVGTESIIEHIKDAHPPSKVKYNDVEVCFVNDLSGVAFKTKAAYVDNFVRAHVYRKVGNDFHRTAAPPEQPGGDCLGVLHRCNFCQSRFSDATLLAHHMATCHVALAHGDRSNGAVLLAAAADKASLVRSVAAVAGTYNNGFDNLVINSAALEKHAIDVVPNGDTAAAASDLQGRSVQKEDIISNSLNMLYQF